jgi:antitoxin MazE
MTTTVQKWGIGLGIRIPKAIARQIRVAEGTVVEFDTTGGALVIRPRRRRRHTLAALLAQAKGANPHRNLSRDGPVGRELL